MKNFDFQIRSNWNMFRRDQLITSQHLLRWGLVDGVAKAIICADALVYWRIVVSRGLN